MYLDIGICPRCRKRPVEPNKRACYECLALDRDRYKRKRQNGSYDQKADTERKRRQAEERRKKGLCYRCGKYPAEGLCGRCKAKAARYREKYSQDIKRSERPSYGRCYICGKQELYEGHKVCKKCYQKRLETIPDMLAVQDHEYFDGLNRLIFCNKKNKSV